MKAKIEQMRKKLYESISKYGLDSEEVSKISAQLDKLLNKYSKA